MELSPAAIQEYGVGVSAFLSIVVGVFFFLSARSTKVGRAMLHMVVCIAVFAWFGFLYHLVADIDLARGLRVISQAGIVGILITAGRLALTFFEDVAEPRPWMRFGSRLIDACGIFFLVLLALDLFGARLVVGSLDEVSSVALAPHAGPLMWLLIVFFSCVTAYSAVVFYLRISFLSGPSRRVSEYVGGSVVLGLVLAETRYAPWYGLDFAPMLGGLAFPLFIFAALYSIKKYNLLNIQVAVAQLLVFLLWTFTFFRMILNASLREAIPDIGLFIVVVILGVFLLRSVIRELKSERELAILTMDKAKSEFVAIAAHQLRTPMSGIRWTFDLLASKEIGELSPQQRSIVEKGSHAADSMVRLVNDLLNVARMADGKFHYDFAPIDARRVVEVSTDVLREMSQRKNIHVRSSVPSEPVTATIDFEKMCIAVENLLDNAVKYSHPGSDVSLTLSRESQPGKEGYRIDVADSGIGFSQSDKARIFERFFRSDRAKKMSPDGSGLGLTIAKTIIEGHGGALEIISTEGAGSTLRITMPSSPPLV